MLHTKEGVYTSYRESGWWILPPLFLSISSSLWFALQLFSLLTVSFDQSSCHGGGHLFAHFDYFPTDSHSEDEKKVGRERDSGSSSGSVYFRAFYKRPGEDKLQKRWMIQEFFWYGKLFSFCWPTRDHIGRSTRNSNPVMTSSAGGAKGCADHRFCAPPAYNVYGRGHNARYNESQLNKVKVLKVDR